MAEFDPPAKLRDALPVAEREMRRSRRSWRPVDLGIVFSDRQGLAEALSGTSDRKSQKYRTSMRAIQRWERGATPSPRMRYKLEAYAQRLSESMVAVEFEGNVTVSKDTRFRRIGAAGFQGVYVPELDLNRPVRFERRFWDSYGLPGAVIDDVSWLHLTRVGR